MATKSVWPWRAPRQRTDSASVQPSDESYCMSPDARECLQHISRAGRRVIAYTQGVTYGEYIEDDLRSAAVERQLLTIGEALRRLELLD